MKFYQFPFLDRHSRPKRYRERCRAICKLW